LIDLNIINSFLEPKEKLLFKLLAFNIAGYPIALLKKYEKLFFK